MPVWDLQTALRVCVVPDTSGLASVSLCWQRARCAHATAGKAPTDWSFSSAATVVTAWPVDQTKRTEITLSAGLQPGTYIPVRDADINTWSHTYTRTHTLSKAPKICHRHWRTLAYTGDADTHTQTTPKTFFPAKVADKHSTLKDRHDSWKSDTPRGMQQCKTDWSNSTINRWGVRIWKVRFQRSWEDRFMSLVMAELFCFSFYGTSSLSYCSKLLYCKYYPGGGT